MLDLAEFFPPFFGGTGQLPSMVCVEDKVLVLVPQLGAILELNPTIGTAQTIDLPEVGTSSGGGKSKFAQYGRKLFPLDKNAQAYRMMLGMMHGEVTLPLALCFSA